MYAGMKQDTENQLNGHSFILSDEKYIIKWRNARKWKKFSPIGHFLNESIARFPYTMHTTVVI